MKRSQSIRLERMRKKDKKFPLKPLAIAVTALALSACGDDEQEVTVYSSVQACVNDHPAMQTECQTAFDTSLRKAQESGPKYRTLAACNADFGVNNCTSFNKENHNDWYIPLMTGFMFSQALNQHNRYNSAPLYTSYARSSTVYHQWVTVDGYSYGKQHYGPLKVDKNTFEPKPKVTKTLSRGGFGSIVAAKSNWSGSAHHHSTSHRSKRSKRSRSWGG